MFEVVGGVVRGVRGCWVECFMDGALKMVDTRIFWDLKSAILIFVVETWKSI